MDELSDKDLQRSYWWLLHRQQLRRLSIGSFILIIVLLLGYSAWQYIDWLASRQAEEESLRLLVSSTVNVEEYRQRNSPLPLEIGKVMIVPNGSNNYDLVAPVKNPNLKWAARQVNFSFTVAGQTYSGISFVLPLEDKYLLKLGVNLNQYPAPAAVNIDNINWQRIRDYKEFTLPNFIVSDEEIQVVSGLAGRAASSTNLNFILTNNSPYSFWQVPVTVILTRNSHIEAVGQQVLPSIDSNQSLPLQFYWPGQTFSSDHLIVKPEVNVLDPAFFKPLR